MKTIYSTIRLYTDQSAAVFPANGAQPVLHLPKLDENDTVCPGMINIMRVAALFSDTPEGKNLRDLCDQAVKALNEDLPSGIILPN